MNLLANVTIVGVAAYFLPWWAWLLIIPATIFVEVIDEELSK